ncbi:MAG: conjugal transfer protein TrbE [Opitutaceae bacterium]|nr:conjugal transfer protein TrbE [Opitutaceae bacterium]
MFNLSEYNKKTNCLADYLPWAALVGPGVVLNKDGSFMRCARFRGPDLESATEAELVALCARLNDIIRRFGSGWALFFEADRMPASDYPASLFPDPLSGLIDAERKAVFETEDYFESRYVLSLLWLPPEDKTRLVENLFFERPDEGAANQNTSISYLESFYSASGGFFDLLADLMPAFTVMEDGELLGFLHGTISTKHHPVAVPETPIYLDALLPDDDLTGGLSPMLGDHYMQTITVRGFPGSSTPGLLDGLNHLGMSYRWVTRFIPMDKAAATKELTKFRRQWFAKRKGIGSIIKEAMTNEASPMVDTDADNKALDADIALQELGSDFISYGYFTATVTVMDKDPETLKLKVREITRVINGRGFVTITETLNAVEAWLGSLPGHVYANVRQPLLHSLNLCHLLPLSAIWAGPAKNQHLNAPALLQAKAEGNTPFRLSLHQGDVGHTLIVGPTGAGKSVLLSFIALQFRRYEGAQIYIFDKGGSARASILGIGGQYHSLSVDGDLSFQPLAEIDRADKISWALTWILSLLTHENVVITPEVKQHIWSALENLKEAPREERTLTGLSMLLQDNDLKQALQPYLITGPYGQLLDGDQDRLTLTDIQCFEMEELMESKGAVLPVLTYLFHRLEEQFDGRPSLLILDEAWLFLDNDYFAEQIREWLKVLRKKNVSVIFATQSLADIQNSKIAPVITESCPTRIYLPNDRALEPLSPKTYQQFGLNDRQIQIISQMTPKRDYYVTTPAGNRRFDLELGSLALAFVGASTPEDHQLMDKIIMDQGTEHFAKHFLQAKGLCWAADLFPLSDNGETS